MEIESMLKSDELKEIIREIVHEQLSPTFEDMEEIRRSPAGAIIRIEEDIKSIKQNMATRNEYKDLEGEIKGLPGRFDGLESRMKFMTALMFVLLTLFGGLVVKLIIFPEYTFLDFR